MRKTVLKHSFLVALTIGVAGMIGISSCSSKQNLLVPHAVSTAASVSVRDLDLKPGQYEIIKTVTETASVSCRFNGDQIRINGDDFTYNFVFNKKTGWTLSKFSGAASLGYFSHDVTVDDSGTAPRPEEFARRVAMARIISAAADYGADGIIEPLTTTVSSNSGNNTVEFTSTVRAKLITVKPTR